MNERYMQRGVSASKEDVHAAIRNVDKGLYPKAFCKIIPRYPRGEMKPIVTSCMQMVRARSLRWPTSIGVRRVTSLSGRV